MKINKIEYKKNVNTDSWSEKLYDFSNINNLDVPKISVNIMVKNEERCIERCIDSISQFADEVIIVDTGSTDNTLKLINSYNINKIKLFEVPWSNDFSKIRNYMIEKSSYDWIFQIDADEYLVENPHTLKQLIAVCELNKNIFFHFISPKIQNNFNDIAYILTRRIFRKYKCNEYFGFIHEELRINSHSNINIIDILVDLKLLHDGYNDEVVNQHDKTIRNINSLKKMLVIEPYNPRWYYFLARDSYSNLANLEKIVTLTEIETLLKQAMTLEPINQSENFIEASYILLSQIYFENANYKKLKLLIDKIKQNYPQNVDSYYFELLLNQKNTIQNNYNFLLNLLNELEINDAVNSKIDEKLTHILFALSNLSFNIDNIDQTALYLNELDEKHQKKFVYLYEQKLNELKLKLENNML